MFRNFFKGKKILVTGHTGFKGSWLCAWLTQLGAEVAGYSLETPPTNPCLFDVIDLSKKLTKDYRGDIRDNAELQKVFTEFKPEMVFHLAAQAILLESIAKPEETLEINIMGTVNLLKILRNTSSVKAAVIVTSDKCYEPKEGLFLRESDRVGGKDPYSASKACMELIVHAYQQTITSLPVATARAGNTIGGGDFGKHRVITNYLNSAKEEKLFKPRNPDAERPWIHVMDVLSGYLCLAKNLYEKNPRVIGQAFNFGPVPSQNKTVNDLIRMLDLHRMRVTKRIPEKKSPSSLETHTLRISIEKSIELLNWWPVHSFESAVISTVNWHKSFESGQSNMTKLIESEIGNYQSSARWLGVDWAQPKVNSSHLFANTPVFEESKKVVELRSKL